MKRMLATLFLSIIICSFSFAQTSSNMFVTGYYPIWSYCTMRPADLDYSALTHIILFSADPDPTTYPYFSPVTKANDSSSIEWGVPNPNCAPPSGQPSWLSQLVGNAHGNGVKVLLCLGGIWGTGASNMAIIAADSAMTEAWAQSATNYILRKNMDGFDLDWEWPNNNANFFRMLRILRKHLNGMFATARGFNGVLTIAAPTYTNTGYFNAEVNSLIDQANLMAYDMSGGSQAWFNAGLASNTTAYGSTVANWWTWKNHGINQVVNAGMSKSKLSMGIPFYSWRFSGPTGVMGNISGRWYGTYNEAITKLNTYGSGIYHWDDSAKAPYLTYTENGTNYYITYDDTNSVKHKVKWVKDNGGGGVMLYELVAGWVSNAPAGKKDPLLQAVKSAVNGGTVTPPPPVQPPSAPVLNTPADGTTDVATGTTVSWSSVSGATSYRVQVSTSSTFGTTVVDQAGVTATSFAVNNLLNSTTYYWRVNASNSAGSGNWSAMRNFTVVSSGQPPVPADTIPYPAVLRDDFNRPDGPLPGTNRWKAFDNYTGGTMSVVNNKLQATNGLTVNTMGGVVWDSLMTGGTEASVTLQQKSGNVTNASLLLYARMSSKDYTTGSGYRLRFTEQSGNDLLEIHRITNGYTNSTVLASVNYEIRVGDVVTFRVLSDNKTMCILVNGIIILSTVDTMHSSPSWYFALRGYVSSTPVIFDDFRVSPNAATIPLGLPVLTSPGNSAENVPANPILSWEAETGAETYRVQLATDAVFGNIVVDDSTVATNSLQISDLNLNTLYYWRVNGKNLAGTSEFSEIRSFTTTSAAPAIIASPNSINFGKVGIGYSKKDSLTISNPGSTTISLSQIQSTLAQYTVEFTGTTILPGGSKKMYVTFTPSQRVTYNGKIAIVINSGGSTDTAFVTGKGVRGASIRHNTVPVNFGVVQPEELKTDTITVYNDGELSLDINNITSTNSVFTISPQQAVIAPEDSQKFVVSAHPTLSQEENGYFLFEYNGSAVPDSLPLHIDQSTGIDEPPSTIPGNFALYQNYPNPFNPSTTIAFDLASTSIVHLRVYNALGQEVQVLYSGQLMSAGKVEVLFSAAKLPSGIYYCKFTAQRVDAQGAVFQGEPFVGVSKMMLIK